VRHPEDPGAETVTAMDDGHRSASTRVALYLTAAHGCSYLPGRTAQTLFLDPTTDPDPALYQRLLETGFRRSGNHVYRPQCPGCSACVPVRIPVDAFRPRRSQRRAWQRNRHGIEVRLRAPAFDPEHYALYRRYTSGRHPRGGMADADPGQYLDFLTTEWCSTRFAEFRREGELLAVAVTDLLPDALSAVYTFFGPEHSRASPGVFAILWQIAEARRRGLAHLYLGYWIAASDKMRYKDEYRPLEWWDGVGWRRCEPGEALGIPAAAARVSGAGDPG
jgi:arginine-tRNA-protein transferase